jgi:hypothetical protein
MSRGNPEKFRRPRNEDRGVLFTSVGMMAIDERMGPIGAASSKTYDMVDPETVPGFITSRLPVANGLAIYAVRATITTSSWKDKFMPSTAELAVNRTVMQDDGRHATRWEVRYSMVNDGRRFPITREVSGIDYMMPRALTERYDADDPESSQRVLRERFAVSREVHDSIVASPEPHGPWPEGLVVPETEQLIALTTALLPPNVFG